MVAPPKNPKGDQARKSDRSGLALAKAFLAVIGATCCVWLIAIARSNDPARGSVILIAVTTLICGAYFATLFHELGHVLSGVLAGMQFRQILIGPLGISRYSGRSEMFINRRWNFGGFAYMVLPKTDDPIPKIQQFIRGGPAASVLLTALTGAGFVICGALHLGTWTIFSAALFVATVVTLSGTLFSYSSRGNMTDVLLLKRLSEPGPQRDVTVAWFTLSTEFSAGVRARDWNEAAIKLGLAPSDSPIDRFYSSFIAYLHYADRGDLVTAGRHFVLAEKEVGAYEDSLGLLAAAFWLEKAYVAATILRDLPLAKASLARVKSRAEILDFSRLLAEAAIEVEEGDRSRAESTLVKANRALERSRRRTGCNTEQGREAIQKLKDRANLP